MKKNQIRPFKKLSHALVYDGFIKIEKDTYTLPNGSIKTFDIKKGKQAVSVFAHTKDEKIVVIEQFRPGPDKVLLELPGGYVEIGELPERAGERELLEETGYCGVVTMLGKVFDDAYSDMHRTYVIILNCVKVSGQQLDDSEYASVQLLTHDAFRELLRSGNMTDVEVGYLALDRLGLL